MDTTSEIGIVILAAGASRRMGQAKQLLEYKGKTLIENVCDLALQTACTPIVVVLGAKAQEISQKTASYRNRVEFVLNPYWEIGMSTSLREGLNHILSIDNHLSGVMVLLVDQPFINLPLLTQLLEIFQKNSEKIVASQYDNILGVPAIFPKAYFKDLLSIKGDKGARKVLVQYRTEVIPVVFSKGNLDLDTLEDYQKLIE